tara:strand:- start:3 stop:215 length:213 start_codon:yes stop_codon:yes gene_type:complete
MSDEEEPRFSVMLARTEIEAILSYLRSTYRAQFRPTSDLIERLERRLLAREKELKELMELMAQPEIDVGI